MNEGDMVQLKDGRARLIYLQEKRDSEHALTANPTWTFV